MLSNQASSYKYDATGLSNDPSLPPYLQSLTASQLQTALDGGSPNQDLISLLEQDITGTGAGWLPDASGNTGSGFTTSQLLLIGGLGIFGLVILTRR